MICIYTYIYICVLQCVLQCVSQCVLQYIYVRFALCMICGRFPGLRHFVSDTTHSMCYILILYVTYSFHVWHDSFYVCDTKHSTRDILICDILIPCVTRLILCVTWLILCVTWLILCVTCLILYTTWLNSMCDMPHSCLWFVAGTRAWSRRGVFGEGRWDCETDEQNRRCIGVLQVCRPEPWTWTLNLNPQT